MKKRISTLIILAFSIFSIILFTNGKVNFDDRNLVGYAHSEKLQTGDIIFQTSTGSQSKAIQLATHSKYSHVGILYKKNMKMYVYEAIQPVKMTLLSEWIKRGENNHYVVKRLKNADEILTPHIISKLETEGEKYINKDYDIYFGWSDEKIYCSELVWKIYKRATGVEIGELETLADFDFSNEIVKQEVEERYGKSIPLNEKVISPEAIFRSDKLIN